MTTLVFDTEWDNLRDSASRLWVYADNTQVMTHWEFNADKVQESFDEASLVVGHNIIGFDLPLLKKFFGITVDYNKVIDTLVWSRLLYPDLQSPVGWKGQPRPHSLEAWAMRLGGEMKVEQETWDKFDPNMVTRCKSDVLLTEKLYLKLRKEVEG